MNDQNQPQLVDTGHDTFEIIDPDGRVSGKILMSIKDSKDQYRIRYFTSTQEIYDETGKSVARTSDPEMAKHIRSLLIAWEKHLKKQAANQATT